MHRWFRFSAGIALVSLAGSGIPLLGAPEMPPGDAAEESAMPTPGKHQLRPTPLQIAQHRIEQQAKRADRQDQELERLAALVAEQGKKLEEQAGQIAALSEALGKAQAALADLDGRFAAVDKRLEKQAPLPALQGQGGEGPILRAEPVEPFSREEAATASTTDGQVYVIKKGDNLITIARQHGTTVAEILKFNKIEDERKLQIGQRLILPRPSRAPSADNLTPTPPKQNGHDQVVPDEAP